MFLYPTHRVSIRRRPLKLVVIKVIVNINAKIPHQGLKWIQALCVMPSMRMNVKPARLPKRINQHISPSLARVYSVGLRATYSRLRRWS